MGDLDSNPINTGLDLDQPANSFFRGLSDGNVEDQDSEVEEDWSSSDEVYAQMINGKYRKDPVSAAPQRRSSRLNGKKASGGKRKIGNSTNPRHFK